GTADHAVYRKRSLYRRNRSRDESSRQDRGGPPLPDKKEAQTQTHHRIDSICRLLDRTRKLASPGKIAVIVLRFPISHLSDFFCLFFMMKPLGQKLTAAPAREKRNSILLVEDEP